MSCNGDVDEKRAATGIERPKEQCSGVPECGEGLMKGLELSSREMASVWVAVGN